MSGVAVTVGQIEVACDCVVFNVVVMRREQHQEKRFGICQDRPPSAPDIRTAIYNMNMYSIIVRYHSPPNRTDEDS